MISLAIPSDEGREGETKKKSPKEKQFGSFFEPFFRSRLDKPAKLCYNKRREFNHRGVAQLVARDVWEQVVAPTSRPQKSEKTREKRQKTEIALPHSPSKKGGDHNFDQNWKIPYFSRIEAWRSLVSRLVWEQDTAHSL